MSWFTFAGYSVQFRRSLPLRSLRVSGGVFSFMVKAVSFCSYHVFSGCFKCVHYRKVKLSNWVVYPVAVVIRSVMIRNNWLASCSSEVGCSCRTSVKIAKYHQSFFVGFGFDSFTEKCVLPIFFSNCWVLSYFPNFPRACLMVGWLAMCTCNCWWKSIECRGSQLLLSTIWAWNSRNLFFRW